MNPLIFVILITLSGAFAIYGKYSELKFIHYVFKPLTMVLIISLDILLMEPFDKFVQGLFAFLTAHIIYIFAFIQNVDAFNFPVLIPVFTFAVIIYYVLYKKLDRMRIPVLVYMIIISIMGWVAVNRYLNFVDAKSLYVFVGGLLFLFSDSIHAINRFKKQFGAAEVIILGSYFSAQLLFALSI